MTRAGVYSSRGDAYQTAVALEWTVTMLFNAQIAWLEVDSTSLDSSGQLTDVDDVVVGYVDGGTLHIQCKKNEQDFGSWTVASLREELSRAARTLAANPRSRVRFCSRSGFGELAKLREYAIVHPDQLAYAASMPAGIARTERNLCDAWREHLQGEQGTHAFLNRIEFVQTEDIEDLLIRQRERLQPETGHAQAIVDRLWTRLDRLGARVQEEGEERAHRLARRGVLEDIWQFTAASLAPPDESATRGVIRNIRAFLGRPQRADEALDLLCGKLRERLDATLVPSLAPTGVLGLSMSPLPRETRGWRGSNREAAQVGRVPTERLASMVLGSSPFVLILGEAGAGKTTTLLQTTNQLLESPCIFPRRIPVVLNLSTWRGKSPLSFLARILRRVLGLSGADPFTSWLIQEIYNQYGIPRKYSARWLEEDGLILCLDGLDEVPGQFLGSLIEALNEFRASKLIRGCVACRSENASDAASLVVDAAFRLEPLGLRELEDFLSADPARASLRASLRDDEALIEFARLPLMLGVLSVAHVAGQCPFPSDGSIQEKRKVIFEQYAAAMLRDHIEVRPAVAVRVIALTTWIAQQSRRTGTAEFRFSEIGYSHIQGRGHRWAFRMVGLALLAFMLSAARPEVVALYHVFRSGWGNGLILGAAALISLVLLTAAWMSSWTGFLTPLRWSPTKAVGFAAAGFIGSGLLAIVALLLWALWIPVGWLTPDGSLIGFLREHPLWIGIIVAAPAIARGIKESSWFAALLAGLSAVIVWPIVLAIASEILLGAELPEAFSRYFPLDSDLLSGSGYASFLLAALCVIAAAATGVALLGVLAGFKARDARHLSELFGFSAPAIFNALVLGPLTFCVVSLAFFAPRALIRELPVTHLEREFLSPRTIERLLDAKCESQACDHSSELSDAFGAGRIPGRPGKVESLASADTASTPAAPANGASSLPSITRWDKQKFWNPYPQVDRYWMHELEELRRLDELRKPKLGPPYELRGVPMPRWTLYIAGFSASIAFLAIGALPLVKYATARVILHVAGSLRINVGGDLALAFRATLLRRDRCSVGFMHGLLLEYFASLTGSDIRRMVRNAYRRGP